MREAFRVAREGIKKGQSPFGAVIVKDGKMLAAAHNTVLMDKDPTAHAEINAIRQATKRMGTWDLSGSEIYSTTEPCPMCLSAIHWARIGKVYFSTRIEDVARLGFNEIHLHNEEIVRLAGLQLEIHGDVLREEGLKLLEEWAGSPY